MSPSQKESDDGAQGMAPYVAFQSLKTLAANLKGTGLPSRIDRSILGNFSGSVAKQVMSALKFLSLIDGDGYPTSFMRTFVEIYGDAEWPAHLAKVLQHAYSPLFQLKLDTATPSQFNEHFRRHYPGAEAVQKKSMTFFLNAARDANIPISAFIMKNKKPRSGPAKKRSPRGANNNGGRVEETIVQHVVPPPPQINKSVSQVLFEAFDPSNMPHDVQQATLVVLTYLKSKGL